MNKQQLASKIWESANKMRSKIEANEYKDYILGFIFYKFLSDYEVKYLKKIDCTDEYLPQVTEKEQDIVENVKNNIGYFISYENLFSTWVKDRDFSSDKVTDALSAFTRNISDAHKKVFDKIFDTLQTGLSNLGDTDEAKTKAIRAIIELIDKIPMDEKQDYDVLGFIYEYLISNFAANAGKKAGEFYTPHEVSLLMSEIVAEHLKNHDEIKIYDPTSGSGSLLINIGKSVSRYMKDNNKIKYYAQELKGNTFNLTRMNLVMRNINVDNITCRCGDTLEDDWPYFDDKDKENTYEVLYVDAVVSNPPYSQSWNPKGKESDPRYIGYGLAPRTKADYAFLLHDLYHLKPNGIMTIVLPHGVLSRGDSNGEGEGKIRKQLVENNHIDAIIGLPSHVFFGTSIPTIIMVLKKNRTNDDVLIIDASTGYEKVGKNNVLRARDIKKVVDIIKDRTSVDGFSRVVSRDEIRANNYNLNIPRYVDSSTKEENWDLYSTMYGGIPKKEYELLNSYWNAFPSLTEELFTSINNDYLQFKDCDIYETINQNKEVLKFKENFKIALSEFEEEITKELFSKFKNTNSLQIETLLSALLFEKLKCLPLVDKYQNYQAFSDNWKVIGTDIEIIQTEGFSATKQVDPVYVIKKKKGKDTEVQDGWCGHILPFELVQKNYFVSELEDISILENRITEIENGLKELIDELGEDKSKAFVNSDEDGFVKAELTKAVKNKEDFEKDTYNVLLNAKKLIKEHDDDNKKLKEYKKQLHEKTKETIETLTDEQVFELLKQKWVDTTISNQSLIFSEIISEFTSKVTYLVNKYKVTFEDVENQLSESSNAICPLLTELNGNEYDEKGISELNKLLRGE